MGNEINSHLKLTAMGVEKWNSWARTIVGDEEIEELPISDETKNALRFIMPLKKGGQDACFVILGDLHSLHS